MFRTAIVALCTAAALAAGVGARAQNATVATAAAVAPASHPSWVDDTLEPDGHARIARVVPGSPDVVVLDHGLYAGLRVGAPCLIERNGNTVAEIVVVASQTGQAAALITDEAKDVSLQPGDTVRLKTVTNVL
jgi:hypothetical protein